MVSTEKTSVTGPTAESGKLELAIRKARGIFRIAVDTASARRLSSVSPTKAQSPMKRHPTTRRASTK
jgi:hypothetical protein